MAVGECRYIGTCRDSLGARRTVAYRISGLAVRVVGGEARVRMTRGCHRLRGLIFSFVLPMSRVVFFYQGSSPSISQISGGSDVFHGFGKRKYHAQIRAKSGWKPPKASLDPPTHPMLGVPASKKKTTRANVPLFRRSNSSLTHHTFTHPFKSNVTKVQ